MASAGKMHPYDIDHYRFRVIYGLSLAAMVVLLPFTVNEFLQGRVALGFAVSTVVIVFAVSAVGIHRTGRPPFSPVFTFLPVIAGVAMSVSTQGIAGIVTVSVGVAPFVDADDRDGWLRRADDALYAAKAKGRDRVEVG